MDTLSQYNHELEQCRDIFLRKTADYGTAWRVLRTISVTDQIYIKAWRIRTLQEKKVQMVADDIPGEFKGIVNYAIIGLIQLEMPGEEPACRRCPETDAGKEPRLRGGLAEHEPGSADRPDTDETAPYSANIG